MDPSSNSAEEQGLLVPEKFTHHGIGPLANTPKEASQAVHHQSLPQSHTIEGPSSFDEDGNSREATITRIHCTDPTPTVWIPYPSSIIGFRVVVHSDNFTKFSIGSLEIEMILSSKEKGGSPPVIREIFADTGVNEEVSDSTFIQTMRKASSRMFVGYHPFGKLSETEYNYHRDLCDRRNLASRVSYTGCGTNQLVLKMDQCSAMRDGVVPSLTFATLVELGSEKSNPAKDFSVRVEVRMRYSKGNSWQHRSDYR
ncbi:hypothetical protein H4Q26_008510 [Puccinia striiformis f. sp. tritici PST-130]|nr:hypothetical protein H4Q26_008510 [Puccinia striiformis f. sp. tritici PST-130]